MITGSIKNDWKMSVRHHVKSKYLNAFIYRDYLFEVLRRCIVSHGTDYGFGSSRVSELASVLTA